MAMHTYDDDMTRRPSLHRQPRHRMWKREIISASTTTSSSSSPLSSWRPAARLHPRPRHARAEFSVQPDMKMFSRPTTTG